MLLYLLKTSVVKRYEKAIFDFIAFEVKNFKKRKNIKFIYNVTY